MLDRAALAFIVLCSCFSWANAASLEELKRFDKNNNDRLDLKEELRLYTLHKASPVLAKYDVINTNGTLEPDELTKLYKDAEEAQMSDSGVIVIADMKARIKEQNGLPLKDLVDKPEPRKTNACDEQEKLYIRRDKADISIYAASIDKSAAKGASLSYAHNNDTGDDIAEIVGTASFVVARDPCREAPEDSEPGEMILSAYALAPYISLDGKVSTAKQEKNNVRVGFDAQFEMFSGKIFNNQFLTLSPYYQTDFDLRGSAYGLVATWEPVLLDARLGGAIRQANSFYDFFWQLKLEADALRVEDAGNTNLKDDTEYAWLGGTAKITGFILPDLLDDRVYATGEFQYFWDAVANREISKYSSELGYNLTEDGSTSVSVGYANGKDKKSLEEKDEITVKLNYKL